MQTTLLKKILTSLSLGTLAALFFLCLKLFGLAFIIVFLAPLPLLISGIHQGFLWALLGGVWAACCIAFFLEPFWSFLYLAGFFTISAYMGIQLRKKGSMNRAVFLSGGISFILIFLLWKTWGSLFSVNMWDVVQRGVFPKNLSSFIFSLLAGDLQVMEVVVKLYQSIGTPESQIHIIKGLFRDFVNYLQVALPSLFLCFTISLSWLNYRLVLGLLKRTGWAEVNAWKFSQWRIPDYWIWGLIGSFFIFFASRYVSGVEEVLFRMGVNFLTLFASLYFMMGLAIAFFFFEKWRWSYFVRLLTMGLIFVQPVFALVITGLGAFDFWFDFRKPSAHPLPPPQGER